MEYKILLSVEECADYLGIGMTKMRAMFKTYNKVFVVRIGKRSYAHKELLDKWLLAQARI